MVSYVSEMNTEGSIEYMYTYHTKSYLNSQAARSNLHASAVLDLAAASSNFHTLEPWKI